MFPTDVNGIFQWDMSGHDLTISSTYKYFFFLKVKIKFCCCFFFQNYFRKKIDINFILFQFSKSLSAR